MGALDCFAGACWGANLGVVDFGGREGVEVPKEQVVRIWPAQAVHLNNIVAGGRVPESDCE